MLADPPFISQVPKVTVETKSCNLLKFQRLNSIVVFVLEMRMNYFQLSEFWFLVANFFTVTKRETSDISCMLPYTCCPPAYVGIDCNGMNSLHLPPGCQGRSVPGSASGL